MHSLKVCVATKRLHSLTTISGSAVDWLDEDCDWTYDDHALQLTVVNECSLFVATHWSFARFIAPVVTATSVILSSNETS